MHFAKLLEVAASPIHKNTCVKVSNRYTSAPLMRSFWSKLITSLTLKLPVTWDVSNSLKRKMNKDVKKGNEGKRQKYKKNRIIREMKKKQYIKSQDGNSN